MKIILAALALAAACGPREGGPIGRNSSVKLDYELSSEGKVIESSAEHGEPLLRDPVLPAVAEHIATPLVAIAQARL